MKVNKKYYADILENVKKAEKPVVLISACTHGNERIGLKVQEAIKKLKLLRGTVICLTGNPEAFKRNVRFIGTDLNRSFPGKANGSYEEKLASNILPIIKACDVVIDIHSTTSTLKDTAIVGKNDSNTKSILKYLPIKYVLKWSANKPNGVISDARIGIGLEIGNDKSAISLKKNISIVKVILQRLNMTIGPKLTVQKDLKYFEVFSPIKKDMGFKPNPIIDNYKLVNKGDIIAKSKTEEIRAKEDFYPILFGEKNYKDIFGFMGRKL